MTVHVSWGNDDQTIIDIKSNGSFTWNEFHKAVETVYTLAQSVDHKVGAIVHRSETGRLPQGNMLANFRKLLQNIPDNMVAFVIISPSPYGRNIANIFLQIYRDWSDRAVLVANIEEAKAYLNERTRPK